MKISRGFASDNNSGIHPAILKAVSDANKGHVLAYGDDPYTKRAIGKFKEHFGEDVEVYFAFSGTGTNVLALQAMTKPYNAIICAEKSHINVDECGAPEKATGCKLLPIPSKDGKITVEQIKQQVHGIGDEHHVQVKVISITQSTEFGTIYTPEEIREISDYAHENQMLLHMDGARLSNAATSLNTSFKEITADVGVDVLSFGGTKNGLLCGEAVVFFNKELAENFKFIRKQSTQLPSKMRFIAAQFEALLSNDLWQKNAAHANQMASKLAKGIEGISNREITQKVQSYAVFATVPPQHIPILQQRYAFYVWDEDKSEVRWMTSFDTTNGDVEDFVDFIKDIVK